MITENSGRIYRFKLEHNFGFGFAEVYDFTDLSEFDGRIVYVYKRIDNKVFDFYNIENIISSGISLGPIRLVSFPETSGKYASKYIGRNEDFLIKEIPITKELRGLIHKHNNWNNFESWHFADYKDSIESNFVPYSELRNLETRILSHISVVSTKFTMKYIIDNEMNLENYYDLTIRGNLNIFLELINTYYTLEKATKLIERYKTNANTRLTQIGLICRCGFLFLI